MIDQQLRTVDKQQGQQMSFRSAKNTLRWQGDCWLHEC